MKVLYGPTKIKRYSRLLRRIAVFLAENPEHDGYTALRECVRRYQYRDRYNLQLFLDSVCDPDTSEREIRRYTKQRRNHDVMRLLWAAAIAKDYGC